MRGDRTGPSFPYAVADHGVPGPSLPFHPTGRDGPGVPGVWTPLDGSRPLPAWLALLRAAGPASVQNGPAVDGTTFLTYWLAGHANEPRYQWIPSAGRPMLLIEPARTNVLVQSDFLDAGADDLPDGWTALAGAPGVDFACLPGGPHGGLKLRLLDTATAGRGVYNASVDLAPGNQYVYSAWHRTTGAGGASMLGYEKTPGHSVWALPAGPYDWRRGGVYDWTTGNAPGLEYGYMAAHASNPPGLVDLACAQIEDPDVSARVASSWIPTDAAPATRDIEQCETDIAVVPYIEGGIKFLWSPGFASTDAIASGWCDLWTWDLGIDEWLAWDDAGSRFIWNAASGVRAIYGPPAFAAWDTFAIEMHFGAYGTALVVNGVVTANAAAWFPVVPTDPGLAHHGIFQSPQAFGDLLLAGI